VLLSRIFFHVDLASVAPSPDSTKIFENEPRSKIQYFMNSDHIYHRKVGVGAVVRGSSGSLTIPTTTGNYWWQEKLHGN
jgi:hypothetical protein